MDFNPSMTPWEAAARERLDDIVAIQRAAGVIDMFERIIARMWKINVDRFEPSEVGDTNRSLGITANENIRTLVVRESWDAANPAGLGIGVEVTAPNDSLLVEVWRRAAARDEERAEHLLGRAALGRRFQMGGRK